jgi:hypothetical protein
LRFTFIKDLFFFGGAVGGWCAGFGRVIGCPLSPVWLVIRKVNLTAGQI